MNSDAKLMRVDCSPMDPDGGFVEVLDGPALDAAPLGRGRHLRPGRRGDHPHRVKSP